MMRPMRASWNVLVFPGGTEIGLEICQALSGCKDLRLSSAGQDISNHAPFVFADHHILPSIYEEGFLQQLDLLIRKLAIDFIIPAYDDVIICLASHQQEIAAKVVTSPLETCLVARYKSKTYQALRSAVPCPEIYSLAEELGFPVFCKPDKGQGSQGARVIRTAAELALVQPGEILLEHLPGDEFTVDCFSDRERGLLFAGGRQRIRVRNGISVSTAAVDRPEFRAYAEAIGTILQFHGAWFFQVKESSDGVLKILEVAPRIAGSMAFHRVLGVNFALLSLYEAARIPFEIRPNSPCGLRMDRALINRYDHDLQYNVVYIDLDDTLVLRGCISLALVTFLYQCLNRGVRLVLLTKHAGDLEATLRRYRVAQLFDEIVHLKSDQAKADAISRTDGIFVDDSFAERRAVRERIGMPTFDLSMIEMLIDQRLANLPARQAQS